MGALYKRGKVWWLKFYRHGKAHYESSGSTSWDEARQRLRQREGDLARGIPVTPKLGRLTLSDALANFLNDYRANRRRSLVDVERHAAKLLQAFGPRCRLGDIATDAIRTYITERQAAGAKNATVNRELAALKRTLSLAIQAGHLASRPYVPMLKEHNVRRGFFEAEQFDAVRRCLAPDLADFVLFLYVTGWRWASEVAPLRWAQLDFTAGEVRLDPGTTKSDEGRVFPFTRELRELLERRRAVTREREKTLGRIIPFVFHREGGEPIHSLRKAWAKACRDAGVPGRVLHDFRRTACRNLIRAGVPEKVAMQMVGWQSRQMLDRYHIVSSADLRDAAKRLDAGTARRGR